jgi:uncharacterized SAM-binding protein YcdF (DUF218 family)
MTDGVGRLIVVLGYSEENHDELHPICAERLAHAATVATAADVVVLSGWARTPSARPEAELMGEAWIGPACELVIDPDARTTVENAANALDDAQRTAAREVIVVTSRWHAPRATVIFGWQLRSTGARIGTATPAQRGSVVHWLREVPRWAILPFQLAATARRRTVGLALRSGKG